MISNSTRKELNGRSEGMCEAMVPLKGAIYTRCWRTPIEIHHMLTRARGGNVLDNAKETYHLICLCPEHHRMCDGGEAYMGKLLIDGFVKTENGKPVYYGTDDFLSKKYPKRKI